MYAGKEYADEIYTHIFLSVFIIKDIESMLDNKLKYKRTMS